MDRYWGGHEKREPLQRTPTEKSDKRRVYQKDPRIKFSDEE